MSVFGRNLVRLGGATLNASMTVGTVVGSASIKVAKATSKFAMDEYAAGVTEYDVQATKVAAKYDKSVAKLSAEADDFMSLFNREDVVVLD